MVEIRTAPVQFRNGDLAIDAYLAEPTAAGQYPAIVVIQEIFGVNAHIREVTERIAREGYVAIAPAIYQRTAPGFEVGYDDDGFKLGRVYKDQTRASELLGDIRSAIAFVQTLPTAQPGAVGAIGFCFGGHVAYLAATLPEIVVTASFYGAGIATMTPGGGEPTINLSDRIHGTIYVFFGTQDPLIPINQIDQVEHALKSSNVDHRMFHYPATHGFFCDQRDSYDPAAAADAWSQVKELFGRLKNG